MSEIGVRGRAVLEVRPGTRPSVNVTAGGARVPGPQGPQGPQGAPGERGGLEAIQGELNSWGELPPAGSFVGEAWIVNGRLVVWRES